MISAGLEGRLPYMTYPEPWRGQPKQPPEFLRPAPKPIPPSSRYNGVTTTSPNGTRLAPSQRSITKYPSPPSIPTPVNLTQHKDEIEELPYSPYRIYPGPHFSPFPAFTAMSMYQAPYAHMMRPTYPSSTLPPLETYSPTTPTSITPSSTFLSPTSTFSPPSSTVKPGQSILKEKRTPPQIQTPVPPPHTQASQQQVAFKVPSGKEGSLKHRILTRPEDVSRTAPVPLDLQKPSPLEPRKRLNATLSPPRSPKKPLNNNAVVGDFVKGSLIQLVNGELRKIEDMRTDDFVSSADVCPELRLAESTVVKIEENPLSGTVAITLSYNQRRTQVEMKAAMEHPFFVYGQGWASCNPDKTQQSYRLKVHPLQVGDIIVTLTPREQHHLVQPPACRPTTIMTTATSTAMTSRQISTTSVPRTRENDQITNNGTQIQPINLHTPSHSSHSMSPDSLAARRRRWSAPDQICDENDQMNSMKRHRGNE